MGYFDVSFILGGYITALPLLSPTFGEVILVSIAFDFGISKRKVQRSFVVVLLNENGQNNTLISVF